MTYVQRGDPRLPLGYQRPRCRRLPRLGPGAGVRLGALVGELGRIEVPALHSADRPRHIAIAGINDTRQEAGDILQERISVLHRQRPSGGEDRGDLTIGQSERRHAADSAAGAPAYAIWRP
jgi:hypothetical protein